MFLSLDSQSISLKGQKNMSANFCFVDITEKIC